MLMPLLVVLHFIVKCNSLVNCLYSYRFQLIPNFLYWCVQLTNEISSGVWFTAAASSKVILEHRKADEVPADMWHEILQKMGGDYAELSKAVQETYRPDIMGEDGNDTDKQN